MFESEYKPLRRAYGFDEVALVPGDVTINPDLVDTKLTIRDHVWDIPIIASAMDAVVGPTFAAALHRHGGLAVMNLEGVQSRYEDPDSVLKEISEAPDDQVTALLQKFYAEPMKDHLVQQRIKEVKDAGAFCAVSMTPASTKRLAPMAVEAGADAIVVQSTVTTARHHSKSIQGLRFDRTHEDGGRPGHRGQHGGLPSYPGG